jgi:hypothetical protein
MLSDDARDRADAPDRPRLDAGHLLALADDHRRGLHAGRPASDCSRCLLAGIQSADEHRRLGASK